MNNKVQYHFENHESDMADWLTKHPNIDIISMVADHVGYFYVFYRQKESIKNEKNNKE